MKTRRNFLAASLPVAAAVAFTVPSVGRATEPHPDAELLAAWDEYVRVAYEFDNLPRGTTDKEAEPLARRLDACRDRVEAIPATTMEGQNLKLRYLFAMIIETTDAIDAAIYGKPPSQELLDYLDQDYRERMLWNMIQTSTHVGVSA